MPQLSTSIITHSFIDLFMNYAEADGIMILMEFHRNKKKAYRYTKDFNFTATSDWYFTPNLRSQFNGFSQGTKNDINYATCLFCDVDYGEDGHKKKNAYTTKEDAYNAIKKIPLKPSIVVHTGHGFHVYWLFNEPLKVPDDITIEKYEGLNRGLQVMLDSDTTPQINEILRVAGTYNLKSGAEKVEIVEDNTVRYEIEDFEDYIQAVEIPPIKKDKTFKKAEDIDTTKISNRAKKILDELKDLKNPNKTDRSAIVQTCVNSLYWAKYTDDEIFTLLMQGEATRNYFSEKYKKIKEIYKQVGNCIAKAKEFIKEKNETKKQPPDGKIDKKIAVTEIPKDDPSKYAEKRSTDKTKDGMKRPKSAPEPPRKINLFSSRYHLTDIGNSYRFKDYADKNIKYCYAWNSWLIWDQTRWQLDETGKIVTKAKEMINEMYKQAAIMDEATRDKVLKHTISTSNKNRVQALIDLTKNEVPVLHEELDNKPFLLNTKGGTVNLKTGELVEPSREDLLTKRIEYGICSHEPTEWLKFLDDIFMGDQNLIRFIQKAVGYSLTGDISEQCMFILYGTGRNGKSTFLNVLSDILGDYACNTPAETLMIKNHDGIPNDIARLRGMRLVTAYETEDNKRLAEAKIKALTGGDIVTARFMRSEYFEFKPTFKIWLATNHKPRIKGTDEGIWRRIRLIPFNYCVPKSKIDKHLEDKLMAEAEEVLMWAIKGNEAWQKEGLGEPKAVTDATSEYRNESDTIGLFLKETIVEDPRQVITKKALYAHYSKWCEENGEYKLSQKFFSLAVQEKGINFNPKRVKGERCWANIGFKEGVKEYVEEEI